MTHRRTIAVLTTFPYLLTLACGGPEAGPSESAGAPSVASDPAVVVAPPVCRPPQPDIDPHRSLFVSDLAVLEGPADFSLRRVLGTLAKQNGNPAVTATTLFRRLWDTQNPAPGAGSGVHCTDDHGTVNGFPYVCRPPDGNQALQPDAFLDAYTPLAAVNRFDLAPGDGSNCGEYRLIYGLTGQSGGRAFVIFEAKLPNPNPGCGLAACRPIQELWAELTREPSVNTRAKLLDELYFGGVSGFAPVIRIEHFANSGGRPGYGGSASGQIRTNTFRASPWMLKEFKLTQTCPIIGNRGSCDLTVTPVSVKDNPFAPLFDPTDTSRLAQQFQPHFVAQVPALERPNLSCFGYAALDGVFNDAQSPVDGFANFYPQRFAQDGGASPFRSAITAALTRPISAANVVDRAEALSCKGCHQHSNGAQLGDGLRWPSSLGFTHISEFSIIPSPDGGRWEISRALEDVFLPERERIMETFLGQSACGTCAPINIPPPDPSCVPPGFIRAADAPISGRTTH